MNLSRADALAMDDADPLAPLRDAFDLEPGVIYLDGNSLGPPPRKSLARLERAARSEWRRGLIRSWNDADWINLPSRCGARIAPLIGAAPDDVIVADSVSVNIFKLAAAILRKKPGALAYETGEFPTDGYILQGLAALTSAPLRELAPGARPEGDISVVVRSAVHYKTAAVADIAAYEKAAGDAAVIWDLSHAAGAVRLDLAAAGARYAVGCGYKYLNGGPGAPAYVWVKSPHADDLEQPIAGWMGHAAPFDFAGGYRPGEGVKRFAAGTPNILSLTALDAALEVFANIDPAALEAKSRKLGDVFLQLTADLELPSPSPPVGARRGGHVCLEHENGYAVMQALIARGVIGDFRPPNLMRFGFSPLFVRFIDVWDTADALRDILQTESWNQSEFLTRRAVI